MLQQPRASGDGAAAAAAARARGAPKQEALCVLIDDQGLISLTTMRKQRLVSELQLRHRDIRALEPGVALPYPASIFVRKKTVVLNLEGLKVVITRDRTLVISAPAPDDLSARTKPTRDSPVVVWLAGLIAMPAELGAVADPPLTGGPATPPEHLLPYEIRALEGALVVAVTVLGREVGSLEAATHPVLARIRRCVERSDLEAVYDTQNRLDKAVQRVARIKEVLEELLDDESQMVGMCLSRGDPPVSPSALAAAAQGAAVGSAAAAAAAALVGSPGDRGPGARGGGRAGWRSRGDAAYADGGVQEALLLPSCRSVALDMGDEEVGELEDMIEANWLQVDSLLSRLRILQEHIRNTEHLVNLDLDSKRNSLVALGLLIDVVLMAFEAHMTVTSVFGMNLTSGLEQWEPWSLWGLVTGAAFVGVTMSALTLRYVRRRGLLNLPSFGLGQVTGAQGAGAV